MGVGRTGGKNPDASRQVGAALTSTHTHTNMRIFQTSLIFAAVRSRWNEVSRRIELWISIQELNEQGEYSAVELHPGKDISTGGVFQLRQVRKASVPGCQTRTRPSSDGVAALTAVLLCGTFQTGSLQKAAGVHEACPELRHSASAGGGCAVCVHRLCVRSLHQAPEAARQLPGL